MNKIFLLIFSLICLCSCETQQLPVADKCEDESVYDYFDVSPKYGNDTHGADFMRDFIHAKSDIDFSVEDMPTTLLIKLIIYKNGVVKVDTINKKHPDSFNAYEKNVQQKLESSEMRKWKPGYISGKPVNVSIIIPIRIHPNY